MIKARVVLSTGPSLDVDSVGVYGSVFSQLSRGLPPRQILRNLKAEPSISALVILQLGELKSLFGSSGGFVDRVMENKNAL